MSGCFACFGGRPRGRLKASTFPFRKSWPPHTPHGSRRVSAPSRHSSRSGHFSQIALARAMSSSCSEKNSVTIVPAPSLHRASAHCPRSCSSTASSASISPSPLFRGLGSAKTKRPPGFPDGRWPFTEVPVVLPGVDPSQSQWPLDAVAVELHLGRRRDDGGLRGERRGDGPGCARVDAAHAVRRVGVHRGTCHLDYLVIAGPETVPGSG